MDGNLYNFIPTNDNKNWTECLVVAAENWT